MPPAKEQRISIGNDEERLGKILNSKLPDLFDYRLSKVQARTLEENAKTIVQLCQKHPHLASHTVVKYNGYSIEDRMSPLIYVIVASRAGVASISTEVVQAFVARHKKVLSSRTFLKDSRPLHFACTIGASIKPGVIGILVREFPDQAVETSDGELPISCLSMNHPTGMWLGHITQDIIDLIAASKLDEAEDETRKFLLDTALGVKLRYGGSRSGPDFLVKELMKADTGLYPSPSAWDCIECFSPWHANLLAELHASQTIEAIVADLGPHIKRERAAVEAWMDSWKKSSKSVKVIRIAASPLNRFPWTRDAPPFVLNTNTGFETLEKNLMTMTELNEIHLTGDGWFDKEEQSFDLTPLVVHWIKLNKVKVIKLDQFAVEATPVIEALAENTSLECLSMPHAKVEGNVLEGLLEVLQDKNTTLKTVNLWPESDHTVDPDDVTAKIEYYTELNQYGRAEAMGDTKTAGRLVTLIDAVKKGTRGTKKEVINKRVGIYYGLLLETTTIWCSKECLARNGKKRKRAKATTRVKKNGVKKRTN